MLGAKGKTVTAKNDLLLSNLDEAVSVKSVPSTPRVNQLMINRCLAAPLNSTPRKDYTSTTQFNCGIALYAPSSAPWNH